MEQPIKIGFTGDFCPQSRVEKYFLTGAGQIDFSTVIPWFAENDLNIADLECPLTTSANKIHKTGPHLRADPKTAAILKQLKVDLVATANNHFFDFGWDGMEETYKSLRSLNINWLGSGENLQAASQIYYWVSGQLKFAFINVAENEWSTTHGNSPGVNPIDPISVYQQIQVAKKEADFIIVIAHGGHEHYELPSPRMQKLYRFFVDVGASAVISHHTHITSGYEVYKDAPIFYSLGNFCFDLEGTRKSTWNKGLLVRLIFEKNKAVKFGYQFIHQNDDFVGVRSMNKADTSIHEEKLAAKNKIILDEHALSLAYDTFCKQNQDLLLTWIQPYAGRVMTSAFKRGFLPSLFNKQKKRLLTNLIRCESHRDVLLSALRNNLK